MIVSFEIAKKLKEKGFESPPFSINQFWYTEKGVSMFVQMFVHRLSDGVMQLCDEHIYSARLTIEEAKRLTFAPSVTDILPLVGCFLEWDFVMQKFGIGYNGVIHFFDNPAEGLALFWLNSIS